MPSTSPAQHRFMEAVAHDPKFAAKVKVPQSVGQDFAAADAGKSFGLARQSGATAAQPRAQKLAKVLSRG